MYNYPVLLTGCKEIANYLHCRVRTSQRWELEGLPIERPIPGRRSHLVADSETTRCMVALQRRLARKSFGLFVPRSTGRKTAC
jgi:hypothetical protein